MYFDGVVAVLMTCVVVFELTSQIEALYGHSMYSRRNNAIEVNRRFKRSSGGACKVKADIMFLVDGSNSIQRSGKKATGDDEYYRNYVIKGLKDIISQFDVGKDETQINILFFGDRNMKIIVDDGYYMPVKDSQESIFRYLDKLKSPNFRATYTDKGLKESIKYLQNSNRFKDNQVAKVIFLLTDGMPTVPPDADRWAKKTKAKDILLVPVAIGDEVGTETLKKWASKPEYILRTNFTDFKAKAKDIQELLCKAVVQEKPQAAQSGPVTMTTTTTPQPDGETCKIKADIALLVDGSSSVTKYGRRETKDRDYYKNYVIKALKELVQKFNVNKDEVHIAIIFFGSKNIQRIFDKGYFKSFSDNKNDLIKFLDSLKSPRFGATYTDKGFEEAWKEIQKGGRKDKAVGKIVMLLTDGKATKTGDADKMAEKVKGDDILIATLGIGSYTDKAALARWATKPEYNVVANFDNILGIVDELQQKMCKAVVQDNPKVTAVPTTKSTKPATTTPTTTPTTTTPTTTTPTTTTPTTTTPTTTTPTTTTPTTTPTTTTPTNPETTEELNPTLAPWNCDGEKYTDWNDGGGGNAVFLDRHTLSCGEGKAINYFKLERDDKKIRYKYRCCPTQLPCTNADKETALNDDGEGNALYLDRQNVNCDEEFLSMFKLQRNGGKYQYRFKCCGMPDSKSCVEKETPLNADGGGNSMYLDRHDVRCDDEYGLASFRLVRNANNYQYLYSCCRTMAPTTTAAPTTTPTTTPLPTPPSSTTRRPQCTVKADIVLLVDGSGSVSSYGKQETGDKEYFKNYIFKMIKTIMSLVDVSKENVHLGVLFFGNKDLKKIIDDGWEVLLDQYENSNDLINWLDSKTKTPRFSNTYTADAVNEVLDMFKKSPRYNDQTVGKVIFFMTDGYATDKSKANKAFDKAKSQNVAIVTMGVGGNTDEQALEAWASKPEYYQKAGFTGLDEKVNDVLNTMCQAVKEESPQASPTQVPINTKPKVEVNRRYCDIKYYDASFCYDFEKFEGDQISDAIVFKPGTLHCGAKLVPDTKLGGNVISLLDKGGSCPIDQYPWVDLDSFQGTCVSDPEKCTNGGISVAFWLNVDKDNIKYMFDRDMAHQYFLSSGGQRSDSRGFVLLYQQDSNYKGYKLQVQTESGDFVIELKEIPYGQWFHIVFTWSASSGLKYYQDGEEIETKSTQISKSYKKDSKTNLVIGKPNYGDKYFGRFMMDDLVIYQRVLSKDEVWYISNGDYTLPTNIYYYARWIWPWKIVFQNGPDETVYSEEYFGGRIGEANYQHHALLLGMPRLDKTPGRGFTLWIKSIENYADLGDFAGQCVSDPDLCESAPDYNKHIDEGKIKDKGLDRGLTVSFWLFITEKDVETNGRADQNHQYIISSGGQVSTSRGFAVLYNADIKRFKVQLQTSLNVYSLDFDIPFADLKKQNSGGTGPASGWVMVTFTWNSPEGLKLYINGELLQAADMKPMAHEKDLNTKLTVGKPNHINKHYGVFRMDLLAIFYYVLQPSQISNLYQERDQDPDANFVVTEPTAATTTVSTTADDNNNNFVNNEPINVSPTEITTTEQTILSDDNSPGGLTLSTTPFSSTEDLSTSTTSSPPKDSSFTTDSLGRTQSVPTQLPEYTDANGAYSSTVRKPVTNVKPASTPYPTATPDSPGDGSCPAKAEIVFIVDNSGSIEMGGRDGYFKQIKLFVKTIAEQFQIGNGVGVAIIEASRDARVLGSPDDITNNGGLEEVLDKMHWKKETSFIGKALEIVRTDLFSRCSPKPLPRIVVVVTHGYSSDDPTLPALELKDTDVTMIGVVYGEEPQMKRSIAETISSTPRNKYLFTIGYDQLIESAPKIIRSACEAALEGEAVSETNKVYDNPPQGVVTDEFKFLFLKEANKYRRMHSAVSLIWSNELSVKAQQWAEYIAKEDKLLTKPKTKHGQTLFMSLKPGPMSAQISVRAWYNQIIYYDFQRPAITDKNSYFVQLLWRSTTEVGVGKFQSPSGNNYIVAFYYPADNSNDELPFNVIAMTNSANLGVPTPINPEGQSCPEGYQGTGTYCYKLYAEAATWEESVATCSAQKASLASITQDEEYGFIITVLHSHNTEEAWVGLNDRLRIGSYSWVDGAPLSFNGWLTPPIERQNENCVSISSSSGWRAMNCEEAKPFICKTVKPNLLIFMVTIHYPAQPWSQDLGYGNSPVAVNVVQRVEHLLMTVYGRKSWFLGYTIKAFRGHISLYIDVELRFAAFSPINPIAPLKDVASTQDCAGFICALSDVQLLPAFNITYNGTCSPSCYTSCTSSCPPPCCSPQSLPTYTFEVTQVAPPAPPAPIQPVVAPPQQDYSSYCPPSCTRTCSGMCPEECCTQLGRKRRKRSEIFKHKREHIKRPYL